MQNNLGNLGQDVGREILRRNPLKQHSADYGQREGWVTVYRWDPNRPASGASWSGNQPTAKKVPMTVNGRRIAVINNRYEVSLSGKEVVGITKGEMTLLRYLAANQPLQSVPQNL